MPSIDFYYLSMSAPCRSVQMVAKAVGVNLNLKHTDIMAGDNRTPEFIKMNVQHTIPTMDDSGFYLNESRAMLQYLVNKYGGDDSSLYPKDPKARAQVDMKLLFDMGTLYAKFGEAYYPAIFGKVAPLPEKLEKFEEVLDFLEAYLSATKYVAGDKITIADYAVAATLATIEATGHDLGKGRPKTVAYLAKLKEEIDGYQELNQDGADGFGAWAKGAIPKA